MSYLKFLNDAKLLNLLYSDLLNVKKGDFKVDGKYTFEVGGPSKDFKQIAGVPDSYILADDIDYPFGNKLPLWIIGFLY